MSLVGAAEILRSEDQAGFAALAEVSVTWQYQPDDLRLAVQIAQATDTVLQLDHVTRAVLQLRCLPLPELYGTALCCMSL